MKPRNTFSLYSYALIPVLGLLPLLGVGCAEKPAAGGPGAGGRPPSRVYVATVEKGEVIPETIVVGTVVAKRTSVVASGADGKVNRFLVREGNLVDEGQELSVLNIVTTDLGIAEAKQVLEMRKQEWQELENGSRQEEIEKAAADVAAAKSAMDASAIRLKRQQDLARNNAVNLDDLDSAVEQAETTKKLYESAIASAKLIQRGPRQEQINQAKARYQAQVEQVEYLEAEKGKRTTRAPFKGVVVAEHTQAGQWLGKGDPVVTIADMLDEVYVIANVDQLEIDNVRPGTEVDIEIHSPGKRYWKGTVESLIPRSQWEGGSRTFPVKVVVKNEILDYNGRKQSALSEGMYARVTFQGVPRKALLVPKNSVIRSENGSRVVSVLPGDKPDAGTAKLVMIEELGSYKDSIEAKEGELTPGMLVVTEGAERLSPFQPVQIVQPEIPADTPKVSSAEKIDSVSEETD
ncbi:efflux RND transporter periplasmic adaptor subunit [Thalassoglobus polymorphus]|uniref:Multidrug resistance protein MdtN n=1 Tax=Thalassoglobus polymorphus TaxID=2527994 RepID=A0A517QTX2_9PLAN|nr:HlyD family efflux transporter periplasmic adaptor subunit [Thalassoglobus polymorphus]QDT35094.1 Multidrug resistance protein MdtN [Thalassoglobus polymorphus]